MRRLREMTAEERTAVERLALARTAPARRVERARDRRAAPPGRLHGPGLDHKRFNAEGLAGPGRLTEVVRGIKFSDGEPEVQDAAA